MGDLGATFRGELGDVGQRVHALSDAVDASRGRLPDHVLDGPAALIERAVQRLTLSGEHTIVALAGATGSGKSSLFNHLTDLDLAGVGVRRPTTSWALACAWGPDGATDLLEWMGIPPRHQISRMGMLEHSTEDESLEGLVLLDLPDHDSTEIEHHVEMDRLVHYADALVWVLDPQKYADAAIHDRYLRPLAGYKDTMIVLLNQIDRIDYTERVSTLADVRRILDDDGLDGVTLIGTSASRGDGVDELKRELNARIRAKRSARARLGSEVGDAAAQLAVAGGTSEIPGLTEEDQRHLIESLEDAAGVTQLARAVRVLTRRRGGRLTGWPVTRWLVHRPDISELSGGLQAAEADEAIRTFADATSVGLDGPWRDAVRAVSAGHTERTVPKMQAVVADAGQANLRTVGWWHVVNVLQWLALASAVGGAAWFAATRLGVGGPLGATPREVVAYPLPLVIAVGAVVAGIALGLLGAIGNRLTARGRARHTERVLRTSIEAVAQSEVVEPVRTELDAYDRYRAGIMRARR